ncbi:MAG: SDR family oxidoreductase [Rhodocyclaceae bacterium]|nr:SDR family oxidoreductase [Rhodocyclaceae bacterium]
MKIANQRIAITGAAGGIGAALCHRFADAGARLLLVGRNPVALAELTLALKQTAPESCVASLVLDITEPEAPARLRDEAQARLGGLDILVNNAALPCFGALSDMPLDEIERLVATNLTAPMRLTRAVLPDLLALKQGGIVNIGSTFGAIGFPWFAAYSATKFGLRGFSEALRRELAGQGVDVLYAAPRATRTAINDDRVTAMRAATGMTFDDPDFVAKRIVTAMKRGAAECAIGGPERFFARLNGLLPRLIDLSLAAQTRAMAPFATSSQSTTET